MKSNARIRQHKPVFSAASKGVRLLAILVAVLLLWSAAATVYSSVIHRKYSDARQALAGDLYDAVSGMILTYNGVSVQGADIENTVFPELNRLFATVKSLNSCLAQCYGKNDRVLPDETVASISSALEQYSLSFRTGSDTRDADLMMKEALEKARTALTDRYDDRRQLK